MSAQPETAGGTTRDRTAEGLSLGQLAVRGGGYLIGREAIGMVVRLVGVVVVVRLIGPSQFGIYSAAAAFSLFAASFAQMGLEVYLIRLGSRLRDRHFDQAFTLLLVTSVVVVVVAEALTFALGGLLRPIGVLTPLRVLLLCTPINVLWAPAQAAIERRFNYRVMGLIELGGDVVLYATAIPLALAHHGAWSLVIGFFAWQSWLLVTSMLASGLRPRWDWSWQEVRDFGRHGLGFSSSDWLRRAGDLVNPLVVGSFFGATGVGYVAFALRLVDTVGFAKRSAYRLGLVAMSRVHENDTGRLRYSIEEGSLFQFLSLAVPFASFGVLARWIVPIAFGHQWVHSLPVYSLLALTATLSSCGFVQSTFLYSQGRNVLVAVTVAIRDVILAVAAVLLVRKMGLTGFGVASVISLASYLFMDRAVRRMFSFSYVKVLPWVAILGPPILFPLLPMPRAFLLLSPMVLLALPSTRHEIGRLFAVLRSAVSKRVATTGDTPAAVAAIPSPGAAGWRLSELALPSALVDGWRLHQLPLPRPAGPLDGAFGPDDLTGLPTLAPFVSELAGALGRLGSGQGTVGVMLVRLGRDAGSPAVPAELKAVAARLADRLRSGDVVARVTPSLFAVLLRLPYDVDLESLKHRAAAELTTAVPPSPDRTTVCVSLVAVCGPTRASAEELLRSAAEHLDDDDGPPLDGPHRQWRLAAKSARLAGAIVETRLASRWPTDWVAPDPWGGRS